MDVVADRSRTIVSWFVETTSRARARVPPRCSVPSLRKLPWPSRLKSPAGAAEPAAARRGYVKCARQVLCLCPCTGHQAAVDTCPTAGPPGHHRQHAYARRGQQVDTVSISMTPSICPSPSPSPSPRAAPPSKQPGPSLQGRATRHATRRGRSTLQQTGRTAGDDQAGTPTYKYNHQAQLVVRASLAASADGMRTWMMTKYGRRQPWPAGRLFAATNNVRLPTLAPVVHGHITRVGRF
jgi:hypothetical protein